MAKETERKFLVRDDSFKKDAFRQERISQGYLCLDPDRTVRVRIKGEKAFITIKGSSSGITRYEWEKEISVSDAKELLELALPGMIDKVRHYVRNADGIHTWEVDEFFGQNEGLTVAEIELQHEDDSFARPVWLGEEVSSDPRYYNSFLTDNPYKNWK